MSDAVMVPRAWLLKVVDTLKPFSEVAEKLRHCHVVEICEPHPDNPSPNIAVMPREWLERAGDDLEAAVIVLHRDGALSEGQAAKMTGLDRVEVRKLSDALAASTPVGGLGEPVAWRWKWVGDREDGEGWTYREQPLEPKHPAHKFVCEPLYAAPPPTLVSIDNGSRPQEAVPTEQAEPAVLADGRDISGETVMGMRVAAYRHPIDCPAGTDRVAWNDFFRGDPPNTYSEHWSTPGAHRKDVERLFTEADVRARFTPQPADGCSSNEGVGA